MEAILDDELGVVVTVRGGEQLWTVVAIGEPELSTAPATGQRSRV